MKRIYLTESQFKRLIKEYWNGYCNINTYHSSGSASENIAEELGEKLWFDDEKFILSLYGNDEIKCEEAKEAICNYIEANEDKFSVSASITCDSDDTGGSSWDANVDEKDIETIKNTLANMPASQEIKDYAIKLALNIIDNLEFQDNYQEDEPDDDYDPFHGD